MDDRDDDPGFRRGPAGEPRFMGPPWRQGYIDPMWEANRPPPPDAWRSDAPAMDDGWRGGEPPAAVDYRGVGPKNYRRTDARIYDDVCERMCTDPRVDASGFEVSVEDGVVTLRGTAPDRQTKRLSTRVACGVSGVRDVMNEIRVAAGAAPRGGARPRREAGPNRETRGG